MISIDDAIPCSICGCNPILSGGERHGRLICPNYKSKELMHGNLNSERNGIVMGFTHWCNLFWNKEQSEKEGIPTIVREWNYILVCVDGLQRVTAVLKFMNNEIKVFGSYYKEFEDRMPSNAELLFNVNDLQTEKEVLQWYVDMNSGGTPHTENEIERVKKMIQELG